MTTPSASKSGATKVILDARKKRVPRERSCPGERVLAFPISTIVTWQSSETRRRKKKLGHAIEDGEKSCPIFVDQFLSFPISSIGFWRHGEGSTGGAR
jgi:hypothetical protein